MRRQKRKLRNVLATKQKQLKALLVAKTERGEWHQQAFMRLISEVRHLQDQLNQLDMSKDPLKQYDPRKYDPHLHEIERKYLQRWDSTHP